MNISDPHGHFGKAFNNAELLFLDSFWLQGAKYKTVFVLRVIFFFLKKSNLDVADWKVKYKFGSHWLENSLGSLAV